MVPNESTSTANHKFIDMNKIHLIGGEKGGVGKSVVARVAAQYMIDKNIPFVGFDTDRSHGSLMRFYSDYASPVVVDNYESLDAIVETAVEHPEKRVLVDLAAQTHDPLVKWMDESGVLETAEELQVSFCYWHVMDSGKDSVDLLKKLLDRFGARLNYVIVLNQLRGETFDKIDHAIGWDPAPPAVSVPAAPASITRQPASVESGHIGAQ